MQKAILSAGIAAAVLAAVVALRVMRPPNLSSSDPDVNRLERRVDELLGYADQSRTMAADADRVRTSLWTASAVDAFMRDLPKGWTAQPLASETKANILLQRYAFTKDAATLRDYPEIIRVIKKLEERPSTRIEAVNLVLNQDGQRFATALITATLPLPSNQESKP